jgi:hypothetical protein
MSFTRAVGRTGGLRHTPRTTAQRSKLEREDEIVSPKTPKAASGLPRAASANGSERWRRYEGPLGAALLVRVGARIERQTTGGHAGDCLIEARPTAEDGARASKEAEKKGTWHAAVIGRRPGATGRVQRELVELRFPCFAHEGGHAVAPKRFGCHPCVLKGENHAGRARRDLRNVPPWLEGTVW